jgi:hypothetical protein
MFQWDVGDRRLKKLVKLASGSIRNNAFGSTVVASVSGIKESRSTISLRRTPAVSVAVLRNRGIYDALDPRWIKNQGQDLGLPSRIIFPRAKKQFFGLN